MASPSPQQSPAKTKAKKPRLVHKIHLQSSGPSMSMDLSGAPYAQVAKFGALMSNDNLDDEELARFMKSHVKPRVQESQSQSISQPMKQIMKPVEKEKAAPTPKPLSPGLPYASVVKMKKR